MTVEKSKPKQLFRPITTGTNSNMNHSQFLAVICYSLKAREKSRARGAIGFGFASHWLKNWRDSFNPIIKRSNRNRVITFDSHLKTALSTRCLNFKEIVYHFQVPKRSDFIKFPISGRCSSTWNLLQACNLCRNSLSWTNQELFDFPYHYSVLPTAMTFSSMMVFCLVAYSFNLCMDTRPAPPSQAWW